MTLIESRHNWKQEEALAIYHTPILDLLDKARVISKKNFPNNEIQISSLYNVKTGACPEDCSYCSQSRHHNTSLKKESLVSLEKTIEKAKEAKKNGATRFCMAAAWRSPKAPQLEKLCDMIKAVKDLGLESCATLGMLDQKQAQALKAAGLDYYNHNLDTSENYYPEIITTRTYQDRLDTIEHVRASGMKVCCGGIVGLGEKLIDRIDMLVTLANLNPSPESVPINQLAPIPGTPLEHAKPLKEADFIRIIALARIMLPQSYVRLSAGRQSLTKSGQTLCFMAGANSIHLGPKLLTTSNPSVETDHHFMKQMGLKAQTLHE